MNARREAEPEQPPAPGRHGRPAAGERRRPAVVEEGGRGDQEELRRVPRPARQRRRAHLGSVGPAQRRRLGRGRRAELRGGRRLARGRRRGRRAPAAARSSRPAQSGFGAFAGLYPLDERRLLAASMDSIGTKPIVARERGLLRNCGIDMAAHCVNDVLTCGAEPLFLLDYVAAEPARPRAGRRAGRGRGRGLPRGRLRADRRRDRGAARRLPRGRARLRRHLRRHRRPRPVIDGSRVRARRRRRRPRLRGRARERLLARPPGARARGLPSATTCSRRPGSTSTTCARSGATPTSARSRTSRAAGSRATSPACCPGRHAGEIDWDAWERPPVFDWLARHVDEDELRRVFNLGIGYCAVVPGGPRARLVIGGRVE